MGKTPKFTKGEYCKGKGQQEQKTMQPKWQSRNGCGKRIVWRKPATSKNSPSQLYAAQRGKSIRELK